MPRRLRQATGGLAYHVLNRAVGRSRLFAKAGDYAAFERVLEEAHGRDRAGVSGSVQVLSDQRDHHLLRVCRYVERNALRAGLVEQAEAWRWSSLWRRESGGDDARGLLLETERWPAPPPRDWVACVNRAESEEALEALRSSIRRGAPFGEPAWRRRITVRLGLQSSLRPVGRPRKRRDRRGEQPVPG